MSKSVSIHNSKFLEEIHYIVFYLDMKRNSNICRSLIKAKNVSRLKVCCGLTNCSLQFRACTRF